MNSTTQAKAKPTYMVNALQSISKAARYHSIGPSTGDFFSNKHKIRQIYTEVDAKIAEAMELEDTAKTLDTKIKTDAQKIAENLSKKEFEDTVTQSVRDFLCTSILSLLPLFMDAATVKNDDPNAEAYISSFESAISDLTSEFIAYAKEKEIKAIEVTNYTTAKTQLINGLTNIEKRFDKQSFKSIFIRTVAEALAADETLPNIEIPKEKKALSFTTTVRQVDGPSSKITSNEKGKSVDTPQPNNDPQSTQPTKKKKVSVFGLFNRKEKPPKESTLQPESVVNPSLKTDITITPVQPAPKPSELPSALKKSSKQNPEKSNTESKPSLGQRFLSWLPSSKRRTPSSPKLTEAPNTPTPPPKPAHLSAQPVNPKNSYFSARKFLLFALLLGSSFAFWAWAYMDKTYMDKLKNFNPKDFNFDFDLSNFNFDFSMNNIREQIAAHYLDVGLTASIAVTITATAVRAIFGQRGTQ